MLPRLTMRPCDNVLVLGWPHSKRASSPSSPMKAMMVVSVRKMW